MGTMNRLSDILDNKGSQQDELKQSEVDLSTEIYIINRLNKSDLTNVLNAISSKCDLRSILKNTVPDIYAANATYMDMQSGDVNTGIQLLESVKGDNIDLENVETNIDSNDIEYFTNIAKYAPIRLTYDERKLMRLLDSTLHVSEYTDKIDIIHEGNKARKIVSEIKEVCAIMSGLAIAHNYDEGQRLLRDREYSANAKFFRMVFEIGRRYKILNPDKMRNSYGKLIYFLMDSRRPDIQDLLNFDCVSPVNTVYNLLSSKKNGLMMLQDPHIRTATMEITPEGKSRAQVQREIRMKENAVKYMTNKYANKKSPSIMGMGLSFISRGFQQQMEDLESDLMTVDEVQSCLYSLCDHNSHLRAFRRPCDIMISYLKENFNPNDCNPKYNLSISAGSEGSRLSHNHSRQFTYVLQSLCLWREITHDMFTLWHYAEADLLDPDNTYRLRNTGQGLNRVQDGPNVLDGMRKILRRVQQQVGTWVGSNVIHLGDHNVPNSFIFIDKYTQIPRILNPIVQCLEQLPELYSSTTSMKQYIDSQFGGAKELKMTILTDFFRHAFDGSGADNFNDAGSCIDGRLTSAWNWCSKIDKKKYFTIFLLTGFSGFDGRFCDG